MWPSRSFNVHGDEKVAGVTAPALVLRYSRDYPPLVFKVFSAFCNFRWTPGKNSCNSFAPVSRTSSRFNLAFVGFLMRWNNEIRGFKMFYVTNDTVHANHHSSWYVAIIPWYNTRIIKLKKSTVQYSSFFSFFLILFALDGSKRSKRSIILPPTALQILFSMRISKDWNVHLLELTVVCYCDKWGEFWYLTLTRARRGPLPIQYISFIGGWPNVSVIWGFRGFHNLGCYS